MESSYQVVIIDSVRGHYVESPDLEQEVLQSCADVVLCRVQEPEELIGRIEQADAIISWHTVPLQADLLARMHKCRGIVRAAVGFDNIDIRYAAEKGIPVANVPDYGTEEVADHAIAMLLASVRRLQALDRHVREGGWDWRAIGSVPRLRGMTVGIVGMGRIGTAFARRVQAFGMQVAFYDPYIPNGMDKALGVTRCESLHELLSAAQIVSVHTPLSEETRGMIGPAEFAAMRPETILINTARGPVIDQEALIAALQAGRIRQAALDVLCDEPQIPEELNQSERVLLTPHAAFFSDAVSVELRTKAAQSVMRLLLGQEERCIVNGVRTMYREGVSR